MNTRIGRRFAGIGGILLLVTLVVGSTVAAPAAPPTTITLVLKAPLYQLAPTGDGYTAIRAEGCGLTGEPGQALLPHQLVDVALPPDVAWDSLSLTVRDVQTVAVPGTHKLRTAVPDQPNSGSPAPAPLNPPKVGGQGGGGTGGSVHPQTWGPEGIYEIASIAATGQMRKWRLARVNFCPFQYDATTGQLHVVEQATVELRFARTGETPSATMLADTVLDDVAATRFVNYAAARAWYPHQGDRPSAATYDYVIITTNAIESSSTKLANFVAHKQARGYSVLVVTEDEYGSLTGQAPDGRAEKVRKWLIDNYAAYSIKYVLLIGDPTPDGTGTTDLPMKMCWPRRHLADDKDSPTDYFFADLTGDWDKNGNTFYGEWNGDYDGVTGGVDFTPEVYVGRIPFYGSYTDLDDILQKTMDYENETNTSWRKSILLPMSFSTASYDGAPLAQQMWDDYLTGAGYSRWRQYQQGNGACGPDSTYASDEELRGGTVVRDRWAANDYGIVCWWAHGSATSAIVGYTGCNDGTLFSSSQTSSLDDDHPAFTYQCSCTNGYPENTNNLGYAVLKRGGIATVSASRVSWFNTGVGYGDFDGSTTNSGIGYEYVERVVAELPASEALYGAKSSMTPGSNTRLMNFYDFNLYGDPAVQITGAPGPVQHYVYLPLIVRDYSSSPLYFDDFGDPGSGWPTSDSSNYALDYNSGNYRIQIKRADWAVWAWPGFACADGTIEVEAWRSSGANSLYGIVFGLNSSGNQFYNFRVQPGAQMYVLRRYDEGTWVTLIPYTSSSHINSYDSHNLLKVTRAGSQIQLYVNGHYLDSYTDSTYSGTRYVGVYGGSGSTYPVSLRYDDFTVWGAGSGAMSATGGDVGGVGATVTLPDLDD